MENYAGDRKLNSLLEITWWTRINGVPTAPSSAFVLADLRIYKDASDIQRTSTAGWTINSPFDSIAGYHACSINLANNTDPGFYVAGADYYVVLVTSKTVGGLAIGATIGSFSIENRSDSKLAAAQTNALTFSGGFTIAPSSGVGLTIQGAAGSKGLLVLGGTSATAAHFLGGAAVTSTPAGDGVLSQGGAASTTAGGTAGTGLRGFGGSGAATNEISGRGMVLLAGADGGAGGNAGARIEAQGPGTEHALVMVATGDGAGIASLGGPTGPGVLWQGGSTSGEAVKMANTSGDLIAGAFVAANFSATVNVASNLKQIDDDATAAVNLKASAGAMIPGAATGTPTTTSMNTDIIGYLNSELIGRVVVFSGGVANGQAATILTYTATGGIITFSALITAPVAADTFAIV
jgi:hypothetical protein